MAYKITQDGKKKDNAKTYNEALMKLHRLQGQSWDYAMKHGGWKIEKEEKK
jgi:hypothetical protein